GRDALGYTETDAKGEYALSVNATGAMTVEITAEGLLPTQRTILPRPNEITDVGLVKLIATDVVSTLIGFGETWPEIQTHYAAPVIDARGTRQAALLFHPMTRATLHYPEGVIDEVAELHVTATEFTAGEQGPEAMPADIAFGTIFTYALEFSATEIEA